MHKYNEQDSAYAQYKRIQTDQTNISMTETTHNVNESADKIRVETQVKRGDGTRDEDRIKIKVKGDNPGEVVQKLNETVKLVQATADSLRQMQPGEE